MSEITGCRSCTKQNRVPLDARTGTLLDRVDVAAGPAGMTIDQRTGRVFVGNQGTAVVTALAPTR